MNRALYHILVVFFSVVTMAQSQENAIVLMVSESNNTVDNSIEKYNVVLKKDSILSKVQEREGFYTKVSRSNNAYILKVGPFKESNSLTLAYIRLRMHFPQAFIFENYTKENNHERAIQTIKEVPPVIKTIEKKVYVEKEDPVLWIALFGLGIIGIFALFLSSDQIKHIKEKYKKMQKKQEETEKKQNFILAKMGEKIQHAVIENLKSESKILETPLKGREFGEIKTKVEYMKKHDDELLNTTYEMIDFLKIKSGNIEIHKEPFQLSTLLHKLTNAISEILKMNSHSFYYDVQTSLPRYLVGDSLRIFQVLHNVLSHSLEDENYKNAKVVLSIELEKEKFLVFKIINENQYLDNEEIESLFVPSSWEELQKTNKEVSFFVTNELVSQMDGTFSIESNKKSGTVYELKLPYIEDEKKRSNKVSLAKMLVDKKVLILNDDAFIMKTIKHILESYNIKVEQQLTTYFKEHKPKRSNWDIVILNAKDITPIHLTFFQELREKDGLKVILVHDIFESKDLVDIALQIADSEIYSPIIPGDVEELLYRLYMLPKKKNVKNNAEENVEQQHVKTIKIVETPEVSREEFRKFSGKDVLIAEDNYVNQKVMSSILSASDIHVYKAENGLQVLKILEKYPKMDMILMDMSMPVMDGFSATRKIKSDPKLKHIPIVAVTGLGFNHEIERMGQVGVDACIVKPFKIGQLYTAMDRYIVKEEATTPTTQYIPANRYKPNKEILDVQQGIVNAHNEIFYREILGDVQELLEKSNEQFLLMISDKKLKELQIFCRDTLSLVETIGAVQLTKIFKEILIFLSNKEEVSLNVYIPNYRREWGKLKREMDLYLNP